MGDQRTEAGEHGDAQAWLARMGVTAKEERVVRLLERGLTNPEIANLLGVSMHTVRNQLASVFRKLEVSRRAELVFILHRELDQGADEDA